MGHFVANYNTDSTVVFGIISIGIEVGCLKDTCGEADFVGSGVVIGVYGLRRHVPAVFVDGFTVVGEVAVLVEDNSLLYVSPIAVGRIDFECRVINPLVGITDFHTEV